MKTNIAAEQKRIEREYARLCQCYSTFNQIKQGMAELREQAAVDPAAAKKLNDLQALLPDGIAGIERQAQQEMAALNNEVRKLQSLIENSISKIVKS